MAYIDKFDIGWIVLNYNCNNQCKWCYANSNSGECSNQVMPFDKAEKVSKLFKDLKVRQTILIGGEPTLYRDIAKVVRETKENNQIPSIVTNGRRFSSKRFTQELRGNGLIFASVSVEGSNFIIHDYTTETPGSFNETVVGLENLVASGVRVSTNTVISSLNSEDLKALVSRFGKSGVESMSFNILGPCLSRNENNAYGLPYQEAIDRFQEVYEHGKSLGIKIRLTTPMPFCNFKPEIIKEMVAERVIAKTPCQLGHGHNFVVDYNGDIIPCTHLTGYPLFNVFNDDIISREEFLKQYNSDRSQSFRKHMNKRASVKCNDCEEHCSGGCPLYWAKLNPEKEIRGF
jgi:radical SAM protein with 4Fe4S-binding SPASM domain